MGRSVGPRVRGEVLQVTGNDAENPHSRPCGFDDGESVCFGQAPRKDPLGILRIQRDTEGDHERNMRMVDVQAADRFNSCETKIQARGRHFDGIGAGQLDLEWVSWYNWQP